ncbi:MAG: phage holin family protein [Zoogloeaceae bacterium]|nr:phage holin family protein [Zoogloeaceae bacterium]
MTEAGKPRQPGGLRGILSGGIAIVQARLELFAVEAEEEKMRLAAFLLNLILAALFIGFGLIALAILITVALWDTHRLAALAAGGGVLLVAGLLTARNAARLARRGNRMFAASLAELGRDQEALQRRP